MGTTGQHRTAEQRARMSAAARERHRRERTADGYYVDCGTQAERAELDLQTTARESVRGQQRMNRLVRAIQLADPDDEDITRDTAFDCLMEWDWDRTSPGAAERLAIEIETDPFIRGVIHDWLVKHRAQQRVKHAKAVAERAAKEARGEHIETLDEIEARLHALIG